MPRKKKPTNLSEGWGERGEMASIELVSFLSELVTTNFVLHKNLPPPPPSVLRSRIWANLPEFREARDAGAPAVRCPQPPVFGEFGEGWASLPRPPGFGIPSLGGTTNYVCDNLLHPHLMGRELDRTEEADKLPGDDSVAEGQADLKRWDVD